MFLYPILFRFVWRQSRFAFFGALTSVGALFVFGGEEMNIWEVKMKVDGVIKIEHIKASTMKEAQDIFRQMYCGRQTVLISTTPR